MRENDIRTKIKRKFPVTTDSRQRGMKDI